VIAFLLDQGVPRSAVDRLRAAGYDAVHTSGIGLASADDEVILERARRENRVVVTLDADFHALLATSAAREPSTIRIRQEGLHGEDVARIVAHVVAVGAAELQAGVVVTVREGRIRWRKLPI
jgi:predicted nuclease of predicted toxin-antitoxin system